MHKCTHTHTHVSANQSNPAPVHFLGGPACWLWWQLFQVLQDIAHKFYCSQRFYGAGFFWRFFPGLYRRGKQRAWLTVVRNFAKTSRDLFWLELNAITFSDFDTAALPFIRRPLKPLLKATAMTLRSSLLTSLQLRNEQQRWVADIWFPELSWVHRVTHAVQELQYILCVHYRFGGSDQMRLLVPCGQKL